MKQLELFAPSSFYFAMTMTRDQRLELSKADFGLYNEMRWIREQVKRQTARATFCAKLEEFEYSRLKR